MDSASVVLPGPLSAGLGVYTPAHSAQMMAAIPATDAAAAGGMVNMTPGIGPASAADPARRRAAEAVKL